MKATGIVRRIDNLGRIVVPKELRSRYGWTQGDPIEIYTTDDGVLLRKYKPLGVFVTEDVISGLEQLITYADSPQLRVALETCLSQLRQAMAGDL